MTQEEKEKIDYEIKAKIHAQNKERMEWVVAGLLVLIIAFILKLIQNGFIGTQ